MRPIEDIRVYRTALAFGAAIVATGICVYQRHVHVVLTEPATYTSPLHHRCGLLMLGCVLWAAFEMIRVRSLRSSG